MRTGTLYWGPIDKLEAATSKITRAAITKSTGVSQLPLCVACKAFLHQTYFPLDPFHLFRTIWPLYGIFGQYSAQRQK